MSISRRFIYVFLILLLGFPALQEYGNAQSMDVEVVDLTDLVRNPVVQINTGWKFQAGDSLIWATKDYDDSSWPVMSSVIERMNLDSLKKSGWNGIGWFRKKIVIDSSLSDFNLAFTLYQRAATETYIDGRLWKQLGKVSTDAEKERLIRNLNFFISPFEFGKIYQIAVRVSNHKVEEYINNSTYGGFSLVIAEFERLLAQDRDNFLTTRTHATILVTFTGAFFLLHVLMFLFYPKDKSNLWYALAIGGLSLAIYFSSDRMFTIYSDNIVLFRQLEVVFVIVFHVLFLRLCYALFNTKLSYAFAGIVILAVIYISYSFIYRVTNPLYFTLFNYIVYFEMARVLFFTDSKSRSSSTWIITIGVSVTLIMITFLTFIEFGIVKIDSVSPFSSYFSVIPVMISMSVFQARDLAKNNEILEYRLARINLLSDQNLKQAKRELELRIESEKQKSLFQEAEYRAKVAELQSQAIAAENQRKTKELEEARNLQLSMLPKKKPHHPYLDIAAHMITASEVGGDFYDFITYPDKSVTIAIGDATGHGLSAGTMVATVKALFRNVRIQKAEDIPELFHSMTHVIKEMNFKKIFMSLSVARFANHEMELSAAGMPPAILYQAETNTVERLTLKGMPLGAVRNFPYHVLKRTLSANDILLFVSDGLTELFNTDREMYGQERIEELLGSLSHAEPQEIIQNIVEHAQQWRGNEPQHDDITLIAIKVKH